MGQEYSTIVQIIVKADRGKAIAWRSVSCKMTCYYIPDVKTLQILSLHFVPTLQSAVYILYPVCSLLSAFCTNRYPWHQYSLFLVTVIRTTHTIYHKIPVCELIRHFRYFRVNTLSFCKNVDVTHNVSSNPPTSKKKILACIPCLCFKVCWRYLLYSGGSPYPRMDGRKIANLLQEGYRMPKPQNVDAKLYDNVFLLFPDGFYRTLVFVRLFVWVACAH